MMWDLFLAMMSKGKITDYWVKCSHMSLCEKLPADPQIKDVFHAWISPQLHKRGHVSCLYRAIPKLREMGVWLMHSSLSWQPVRTPQEGWYSRRLSGSCAVREKPHRALKQQGWRHNTFVQMVLSPADPWDLCSPPRLWELHLYFSQWRWAIPTLQWEEFEGTSQTISVFLPHLWLSHKRHDLALPLGHMLHLINMQVRTVCGF